MSLLARFSLRVWFAAAIVVSHIRRWVYAQSTGASLRRAGDESTPMQADRRTKTTQCAVNGKEYSGFVLCGRFIVRSILTSIVELVLSQAPFDNPPPRPPPCIR